MNNSLNLDISVLSKNNFTDRKQSARVSPSKYEEGFSFNSKTSASGVKTVRQSIAQNYEGVLRHDGINESANMKRYYQSKEPLKDKPKSETCKKQQSTFKKKSKSLAARKQSVASTKSCAKSSKKAKTVVGGDEVEVNSVYSKWSKKQKNRSVTTYPDHTAKRVKQQLKNLPHENMTCI